MGGEKIFNDHVKPKKIFALTSVIIVLTACFLAAIQLSTGKDKVQVDYVPISATAFQPVDKYYNVSCGMGSVTSTTTGTTAKLVAPIEIPHGATITNVTAYWVDTEQSPCNYLTLYAGTYLFGNPVGPRCNNLIMASLSSASGDGPTSETTIDYATINNLNYEYYLYLDLPLTNHYVHHIPYYVTIEYTIPK